MQKEFTVVVVKPRSSFEPAVIARTLYTGLGDEGWNMYIIGLGKRRVKTVIESRVPVRIAHERMKWVRSLEEVPLVGNTAVVDPVEGEFRETPPDNLLVCLNDEACADVRGERVAVIRCGNPVYEAIALIYAWFIRGSRPPCVYPKEKPLPSLVQPVLYIARKLLEAVEWFDNRLLLKPSVVVHTLNKALSPYNITVDLVSWRVEVDETTRQEILLEVYDWRLEPMGEARVTFDTETRVVRIEGVPVFETIEVCIDPEHGRACIAEGECVEVGEAREEPDLESGFSILS